MDRHDERRTVTIDLDDEQAAFVDHQIAHGAFADEASLVREGVSRMKAEHEWLKREIQKGLDDLDAGRTYTYASVQELVDDIMRDD